MWIALINDIMALESPVEDGPEPAILDKVEIKQLDEKYLCSP